MLRVRLPGELTLQATFHPLEPVAHVLEEVGAVLSADARACPFHLFTSPPRTTLRPELSLTQAGLVPAATAILAFDAPLPAALAALPPAALVDPDALHRLGARPADEALLEFPSARSAAARSDTAAAAAERRLAGAAASAVAGAGASSSGGEAEAGAENKPKGPKWLKM